ncbi:MAG TPA: hypothetical protein VMU85_03780 [Stellaceae bacterium]|nr:hypothetical protein [Stellaceae bacterium]
MQVRVHRLWPRRMADGSLPLGLSADEEGLCLAGRCRLVGAAVDRQGRKFYRARAAGEIGALLSAGYGVLVSGARLGRPLGQIAGHMTRGAWSHASIAAVQLGLPDLRDQQAAMQVLAADELLKWNPALHPRWPAGVRAGGRFQPASGGGGGLLTPVSDVTPDPRHVTLPDGDYRPDLKDLVERIANAGPEDEAALRQEINEKYADVGDSGGATALHAALSAAVDLGSDLQARQEILEWAAHYARGNPEDMGAVQAMLGEAALGALGVRGTARSGSGARFADQGRLNDHFAKHGSDFGATSAGEYERQADSFLTGPRGPDTLEKIRTSNGDIVRFNPKTDEFGVISREGKIRTYYRADPAEHGYPTNLDYFNAQ